MRPSAIRSAPRRLLGWAGIFCLPIGAQCAHTVDLETQAGERVIQYQEYLRKNQTEKAFPLLSSSSRRQFNPADLQRFVVQGGKKLMELLSGFEQKENLQVELKAVVRNSSGYEIQLIREADGWHLDAGSVLPEAGFDLESGLEQILQSIETKNCDAFIECAPPTVLSKFHREELLKGCRERLDSLFQLAKEIRKSARKPTLVSENRAELLCPPNHKLVLSKVGDRWYLEDLQ